MTLKVIGDYVINAVHIKPQDVFLRLLGF